MNVETALQALMRLQKQSIVWNSLIDLVVHDGSTVAPSGSMVSRGEMVAAASAAEHALFVRPDTEEALGVLSAHRARLTPEQSRMLSRAERKYHALHSIPEDLYVEHERLVSDADVVWHRAKQTDDYALFAPYLDRLVETSAAMARCVHPQLQPLDHWMDAFQEGMRQTSCDAFFSVLERELPPMIEEARTLPCASLKGFYRIREQKRLSETLMRVLRLDPSRCVLGETEHPFTSFLARDDVRMTTHYDETDFSASMLSVMHEGGHALYELHTPERWVYTNLNELRCSAIHESQSRFFENVVGRSRTFLRALGPTLRTLFPALEAYTDDALYSAVNHCEPSERRIGADELTYPMHIIVRYRVEQALFDGSLTAKDVPERWNQLYRELLGVRVTSNARGALQDSHWATGLFGYFPSYAFGSAYAAQYEDAMRRSVPVDECLSRLELAPIQDWMDEHIWRFGASVDAEALLQGAFGGPFDPMCYVRYLKERFLCHPEKRS